MASAAARPPERRTVVVAPGDAEGGAEGGWRRGRRASAPGDAAQAQEPQEEHGASASPAASRGRHWPSTPFSSRRRFDRLSSVRAVPREAPSLGGGHLCDFLARFGLPAEEEASDDAESPLTPPQPRPVSRSLGRRRDMGGRFGSLVTAEIKAEKLASALRYQILVVGGGASRNYSSRTPGEVFLARAREVLEHKRKVAWFRAETAKWRAKHNPTLAQVPWLEETATARCTRLQEFWPQFRKVCNRSEQPPHGSWPMPGASEHELEFGPSRSQRENRCWKNRAAQSRCSFKGTWEWAQAPGDGGKPSGPLVKSSGRPLALDLPPLERRLAGRAGAAGSGLRGPQSCTAVKIRDTRNLTSFMTPKHLVGTSSSAPNLRRVPAAAQPAARSNHWNADGGLGRRTAAGAGLPPIEGAFRDPWLTAPPFAADKELSVSQYVQKCRAKGIVMALMPFVTGHSRRLCAANQDLVDGDLDAVTQVVRGVQIEEVDLEGNASLTDGALSALVEALFNAPTLVFLRRLSLRRCLGAGRATWGGILRLLSDVDVQAQGLRSLDLSCIRIGMRCQTSLCQAVAAHPALEAVSLAETGLGDNLAARQCVGELLGSSTLRVLDLGWNCFSEEVFARLGEKLAEAETLQKFGLANCAAVSSSAAVPSPAVFFIEQLGNCKTVTQLDLSLNRLDFRAALVIEDVLELHGRLEQLDVSHNPLGVSGLRSLLRLQLGSRSRLARLLYEGCAQETVQVAADAPPFSAVRPAGGYALDLSRPYDRAVMRMLYKTCEGFGLHPDAALAPAAGAKASAPHPAVRGPDGVWPVPATGKLEVVLGLEKAWEGFLSKGVGEENFGGFLERHLQELNVRPCETKLLPLFALWRTTAGRSQEQLVLLQALSKDFSLTAPSVEQLCTAPEATREVLSQLLPSVAGDMPAQYLSLLQVSSLCNYLRIRELTQPLLSFNAENPTGRYKLDLANPSEFLVAQQLLLLDGWEGMVAQRRRHVDTSQSGNRSRVRNGRYQDRPLPAHSVALWHLPERGLLELDYLSDRRRATEEPLSEDAFWNLVMLLQHSTCEPMARVHALRGASHLLHVSAVQLRELLGLFRDGAARGELVVLLLLRLTDVQNEKVFRVRFEDPEELKALHLRLGLAFFPFVQPHQAQFELDFQHHDQRLAANLLLLLAQKECPENLHDVTFTLLDGTPDPMLEPAGVPLSWEAVERMPTSGIFQARYRCSPGDRNLEFRRKLLQSHGLWRGAAAEFEDEEVVWWASLGEVPPDVLQLIEFMVAHYDDLSDAFSALDGADGTGVLTLSRFDAGLVRLRCSCFDGAQREQRVQAVYRYADPNGNGQVTEEEWGLLEVIAREVHLTIHIFLQFLERVFGQDAAVAWSWFDEEGAGQVAEKAWCSRARKAGYFGPAKPIFRVLASKGGVITPDDFLGLAQARFLSNKSLAAGCSAGMTPKAGAEPRGGGAFWN